MRVPAVHEYKKSGSGGRTRTDNLAVISRKVTRPLRSVGVRLNTDHRLWNPLSAAEVRQGSPGLLYKISVCPRLTCCPSRRVTSPSPAPTSGGQNAAN